MRLEPPPATGPDIGSESDFFQRVKKRTLGTIGWERVEPANESGFPDTYFVLKNVSAKNREGTVEFKWSDKPGSPDLSSALVRGTQKSALIEYAQMGGARRFYVCYSHGGDVWVYNTAEALKGVMGKPASAIGLAKLEEPAFASWLAQLLAQ